MYGYLRVVFVLLFTVEDSATVFIHLFVLLFPKKKKKNGVKNISFFFKESELIM